MDQAIDEFLVSKANPINRKLVKKYPIPQLMEFYKTFDGMLFKVEQNPKQFDATAIEWVDPDGTRWITVFNYQMEQGYNFANWGFQLSAMGAPDKYFEQAKMDYLNGLLNRQINPQWISTMNQQTEYTIRKSNEAHQQREAEFKRGVAERQKQWEANQEFIVAQQKNWENRLEARSRTQEHIADVILGKTNIIDPETGEKSKIDHTSNHYWVNSRNEYVGIDASYVDPNKSAFLNNRTWREFKIDDYRN
jgi:cell wall-associated NlpC family hydrolase